MSITGLFPLDNWNFKSHSVLTDLPAQDAEMIQANMIDQHYNKGETIFREGSFSSGIFFIRHGKVKKFKMDNQGSEQIIYVANTGEMIGYHALLSEERYPDSAAALEDSVIAFIPKEDFLEVLRTSKVLSQRFGIIGHSILWCRYASEEFKQTFYFFPSKLRVGYFI